MAPPPRQRCAAPGVSHRRSADGPGRARRRGYCTTARPAGGARMHHNRGPCGSSSQASPPPGSAWRWRLPSPPRPGPRRQPYGRALSDPAQPHRRPPARPRPVPWPGPQHHRGGALRHRQTPAGRCGPLSRPRRNPARRRPAPLADVMDTQGRSATGRGPILHAHGVFIDVEKGRRRATVPKEKAAQAGRFPWFGWPSDGGLQTDTQDEADLSWSVFDRADTIPALAARPGGEPRWAAAKVRGDCWWRSATSRRGAGMSGSGRSSCWRPASISTCLCASCRPSARWCAASPSMSPGATAWLHCRRGCTAIHGWGRRETLCRGSTGWV